MGKMPKIERQLKLYELVCSYAVVQFSMIEELFPHIGRRMVQRDLNDLKDAGLISVTFSRKAKGYIKEKEKPKISQEKSPCKTAYLKKLNRLGTLMRELYNEDIPLWEKKSNEEDGDYQEYPTSKDCYNQLFPGLSERTRQRDFEILRRIGYRVWYDHSDHCFVQDDFDLGWMEAPDMVDDDFLDGTW